MHHDKIIETLYIIRDKDRDLDEIRSVLEHPVTYNGAEIEASVFKYMDDIDSKSSALLTHVSMIIAAISIMIGSINDNIFDIILLLEVSGYIFVATGLLRCIRIIQYRNIDLDNYLNSLLEEANIRLLVYTRARKITIYLTVLFFFSVFLKLLYTILKS